MKGKRILIVDDDEELCEEITEVLRDEGYTAKNLSDPGKCQTLISKENFDIIIVDYKLPGLNGIELLKNIKKDSPKTKVFIASGRPFMEKLIEEEQVSHLVSGIINKPFSGESLLKKIKES